MHDYNKFKLFPVAMKKIILIYALIVISTTLQAYAHSTILGISEEKYSDNIEINLKFDRPPPYSIKQSGRRIDLTLEETIIADAALNFSTDDKIVKFLPSVGEDQAVLSFFLRYTPKKARIVPGQDNTLSLVIDVDNFVLKTRTDIVSDLQRATKGSIAGKNISNPLVGTPYVNDWRLFFSRYEPEVAIKAPVQFTFPPFPLIAFLPPDREKNLPLIPGEVNSLAATGQWNAMEPMVSDLVKKEKDVETKKKLALTYGEVLFRAGDFSGAYKQLYLLNQTYPNEPIAFFAKFLLAGLEAKYDNPYVGDYKLHELEPLLDADSPLTPYFTLLQIETALATNQLDKMRTLLNRDNISFPDTIIRIKELRIADYWYANKDLIKSFVRYQLLNSPALLESHYYSLNGYCDTLYHQKNFPDAAQCYQKLAPHITDRSQLGLVMYRKAMAQLHFRQAIDMISDFSTIADAFPETDAGYKAGIKRADIQFISKKRSDMQSINAYGVIAERAINRETAEEAALKEALVYKIADKRAKSIDLLMTFLRNFRTGPLVETAQAALLDALPDELQHLMQQKDYMKVLVLAKQNQMFFEKKWLDYRILADVALAYQQLNLFDDSENTYRYLMEVGGAKAEENYALPYIKVLFHQGNFDEVETHALQYLQRYPAGKDKEQVVLFRLKALLAAGRGDRAIALLPTPTPDSPEFQELAAALYFQKNDFKQVTEILSPLWEKQHSLPDDARFLLAESLYRQDLFDKAEDFFVTVQDTPSFQDQSLFRLADIRLKKGQTEKAVKLLQQIVDKGKDPLWQNLARKQLDYTATISK
ncbi:MAG: hypothetical protein P4L42_11400 [Desulfocapsaceae bacterium]|nr:hypothetical protein [Desulfocapsaceae bacterium]